MTSVDALGATGQKVMIIFTVILRKDLQHVVELITEFNPQAFYSVQEVRGISKGVFPVERPFYQEKFLSSLRYKRK
ncbi:MAG: DUF2179 domain-containing protein [ANME-2 cluster archaeon]|nr:DUF2179 domain-containing protein [ANME-2 cluster archaeon]